MDAWQSWEHTIIRWGLAIVLLSVWTWRVNKPTKFRGMRAQNLSEEFQVYGLSKRSLYLVGFLKITISFCFLLGHLFPFLIRPAAIMLFILMIKAVLCHLQTERNKLFKAFPAYLVLFFTTYLVIM